MTTTRCALPRRLALITLCALLLPFAACGDTAPTAAPPPPAAIAEPLRRELIEALSQISSTDLSALLYPAPPAATSLGASADVLVDTVPCPLAGVNILTSLIDFSAPDGTIVFDFHDDFRACATPHAAGREWRFTAMTPLRHDMALLPAEDESEPWFRGSITGSLRFEVDTLDGRCDFALQMLGIGEDFAVSGSVCGAEVATPIDADASTQLTSAEMSAATRARSYYYAPRPTGRGSRGVRN